MILHVLISSIAFYVVSRVLPGFRIKSFATALICAFVMAFLSYWLAIFLTPIAVVMALPTVLLGPLGPLFMILALLVVVQTGALILTDKLIEDFEIDSWSTAFIASFLMAIVQTILSRFIH